MRNAAEMFFFGPNPTQAKNAWASSTCLLYVNSPPRLAEQQQKDYRISSFSSLDGVINSLPAVRNLCRVGG